MKNESVLISRVREIREELHNMCPEGSGNAYVLLAIDDQDCEAFAGDGSNEKLGVLFTNLLTTKGLFIPIAKAMERVVAAAMFHREELETRKDEEDEEERKDEEDDEERKEREALEALEDEYDDGVAVCPCGN